MKVETLVCQCMSPEHTLQFIIDEQEKEVYTQIFLNQYRSFWKRVWVAIKYIFNYKCKYGHWDTFMMRNEDFEKLALLSKNFSH